MLTPRVTEISSLSAHRAVPTVAAPNPAAAPAAHTASAVVALASRGEATKRAA